MARIDKYDPVSGGFRAPLAANWTGQAAPIGVGLDANGRVVAGGGTNLEIVGVLCKPDDAPAGSIVDIMTAGEIVEFAGAAGTDYFAADADGAITSTSGATATRVGFTVEATRLIVRVSTQVVGA